MPLLNEAAALPQLLPQLQMLDENCQLILVDGGSSDGTLENLKSVFPQAISSQPGRAKQMNLGAAQAHGEYLLFLHADTKLPGNFADEIQADWGRFDVCFDKESLSMKIIAFFINFRSRWTKIATGDQALFVRREVFEREGGYADIPIMEDVEISKRLRKRYQYHASRTKAMTSARRWSINGVARTILLMWKLRLLYFLGVSPTKLKQKYLDVR